METRRRASAKVVQSQADDLITDLVNDVVLALGWLPFAFRGRQGLQAANGV
jgi:hypothetical protein